MLFVPENKLPDSDDDVCESLAVTKQPFVFTLLPRVLVWAAFDTHTQKVGLWRLCKEDLSC